jgi:hypothetical protein
MEETAFSNLPIIACRAYLPKIRRSTSRKSAASPFRTRRGETDSCDRAGFGQSCSPFTHNHTELAVERRRLATRVWAKGSELDPNRSKGASTTTTRLSLRTTSQGAILWAAEDANRSTAPGFLKSLRPRIGSDITRHPFRVTFDARKGGSNGPGDATQAKTRTAATL